MLEQVVTKDETAVRAVALALPLTVAAGCWVVAVRQMAGIDMGASSSLGSFGFFAAAWAAMMAAMMLPGATPAVLRQVHTDSRLRTVPLFVASYVAVWALLGVAVYGLYRPHGNVAAGAVVIAAGLYELTPAKRYCRRRCQQRVRSGLQFGYCCIGSSLGLMLVLLALGVMNVVLMAIISVVVLAQKLLPARAALDVPFALAIVALGIGIAVF